MEEIINWQSLGSTILQISLYIGAISAIIAALIKVSQIVIKKTTKWVNSKVGTTQQDEAIKKIDQKIEELTKSIQDIAEKLNNHFEKDAIRDEAQLAQLRDRLQQAIVYYQSRGFATVDEKRTVEQLYVSYKKLNGNGIIDNYWKMFIELPDHEIK